MKSMTPAWESTSSSDDRRRLMITSTHQAHKRRRKTFAKSYRRPIILLLLAVGSGIALFGSSQQVKEGRRDSATVVPPSEDSRRSRVPRTSQTSDRSITVCAPKLHSINWRRSPASRKCASSSPNKALPITRARNAVPVLLTHPVTLKVSANAPRECAAQSSKRWPLQLLLTPRLKSALPPPRETQPTKRSAREEHLTRTAPE